jgi:conjugative relaxase-like TrwC/TraI family protein
MLTIKAMAGAGTYAAHHLSNNDYYAVGETITGQWVGRGAELLGLEGAVSMEQFDAIRQGLDPTTGEFLRQRQSADRFQERVADGEKLLERIGTARNLYDFTVSAPKAVSVQAMEDLRIVNAHQTAVAEMAQEMESLAAARVRKAGANDNRQTSNLVVARYDHDTSRELDPQVHTHLVAANLTYDGTEGRWKALQASEIYAQREYLTEVYRNALSREVTKLGYQIADRFEHGKDYGFGIVGIRDATLQKYSRRSAQRDQAISDFMDRNGRLPSDNEVARLVRDTRADKLTEISTANVKAGQRARLENEEARTLKELHQRALERGTAQERAHPVSSLHYAREHVFERVSVAKDYELLTEALRNGRGRVELADLKVALSADVASGSVLASRGEVATRESLERERNMVASINESLGQYQPLGRSFDFVVSDRLRREQKAAVLAVLESRDLAVSLRGAAGTGKTATLKELHRGLQESRRDVMAVAPTASAVEELRKVGFSEATTIARLLADPKQQQATHQRVLIVDEAGMVASKNMAQLIALARTNEARLIFSGDTAQTKSVSEGDALRVLERESKLRSVSLLEVQRQTNADYRLAVEALRLDPAEGFRKLEAMGAIRDVDWRLRAQEVSRAYREATALPNAKGEARSILVVAATHDEIKNVTHAIRQDLKRSGQLTHGETVQQHVNLNWTEAQKKVLQNYHPGQVLTFHTAANGVGKNEALEVVSSNRRAVLARNADGGTIGISGRDTKNFAVFEKEAIELSAGDKLLLQANWRDKQFRATNGELVTVARVDEGRIQLVDGRELPATYRQFTHGYAVTAHRSQGKTVDFEIISAERMTRDLFYVSATRAREGLIVVTSDRQGLQESISVSGDRQSASELARRSAMTMPTASMTNDDFFRFCEAQQPVQKGPAEREQSYQKETHQYVYDHYAGIGLGI